MKGATASSAFNMKTRYFCKMCRFSRKFTYKKRVILYVFLRQKTRAGFKGRTPPKSYKSN